MSSLSDTLTTCKASLLRHPSHITCLTFHCLFHLVMGYFTVCLLDNITPPTTSTYPQRAQSIDNYSSELSTSSQDGAYISPHHGVQGTRLDQSLSREISPIALVPGSWTGRSRRSLPRDHHTQAQWEHREYNSSLIPKYR